MVEHRRTRLIAVLFLVAVLSLSFAAYAFTQTPKLQPWKQFAESSIDVLKRKDGLYVSTRNQSFSFVEKTSISGHGEWFVLKETLVRLTNTNCDCPVNRDVTVEAWEWSPSGLNAKPAWLFHEVGDEGDVGEMSDPFYKVTKFGCCGERTVQSYFAFDTGKKMYQSSVDLAEAFVLNVYPLEERFVSYDDSMGNGKAFLTYGSRDRIICRLALRGVGSIYDTGTKIHFQYRGTQTDLPLELDKTGGRAGETSPFNFVILLQYSDGHEIQMAVHNDDVDLASSSIPDQFKVSKLKLE